MATTLMNRIRVPEGTDPFNAQGDMDALARSVRTIIWAQNWQDAYNKANQAKWDLGWNPSPSNPDYYWVENPGCLVRYDGTRWDGTSGLYMETTQQGDAGIEYTAPGPNEVMLIKHGRQSSNTDIQFGNGYMPTMVFGTPFPKTCLTVTVTPIYNSGGKYGFTNNRMPMVDYASNRGFRIMYPGETSSTNHSFMWQAIGY